MAREALWALLTVLAFVAGGMGCAWVMACSASKPPPSPCGYACIESGCTPIECPKFEVPE